MHLLLGHSDDPCCAGVFARLEARGLPVRIVTAPLAPPAQLRWRLDAAGLASSLYPDAPDTAITGVLVRDTGWLEPGKEKREIKELKAEKLELDGVFDPKSQPDPRIEQVIRALSGLSAKVDQLADQIEALPEGKG